jgi:hypothetical protein
MIIRLEWHRLIAISACPEFTRPEKRAGSCQPALAGSPLHPALAGVSGEVQSDLNQRASACFSEALARLRPQPSRGQRGDGSGGLTGQPTGQGAAHSHSLPAPPRPRFALPARRTVYFPFHAAAAGLSPPRGISSHDYCNGIVEKGGRRARRPAD